MQINFQIPEKEDIELIYQTYLNDHEPDSPSIPFDQLDDKQLNDLFKRYKKFVRVVKMNNEKVGWITIIEKQNEEAINLGFGLYKQYRGTGIIVSILEKSIDYVQEYYPSKTITAATRSKNIAALKSLERAGFNKVSTEKRPPIGNFLNKIEYINFRYPT